MITLYNVVSKDGFIADKDGGEDFIPDEAWGDFLDLCPRYDAVVMGRKTYETIQSYDPELLGPFEKLPTRKIVASAQDGFRPKAGYLKIGNPREALAHGPNVLLTSGPGLNDSFAQEGLLDEVIFNELPVLLGEGIRPLTVEAPLKLESSEAKGGRIIKRYSVAK